jgi:3-hydroxyacyl-CoA dehydrogenase
LETKFLVFKVYSIWLKDGFNEEVDKLTGPVIGRPKSATFRTVDVVGLDTLLLANGIYENCPDDERHELFKLRFCQ